MPNDVFNSTVELMGYDELLDYAINQTGLPPATVISRVNGEATRKFFNSTLTYEESQSEALKSWLGKQGFEVNYNGDGKWTGSAFSTTAEVVTPSLVDSNNVTVSRGRLRQWYGNRKEWDGNNATMQITKFPASGGLGAKALYVVGSVGGAISAAATGISLGKTIAPALYDAMPNFWNSIGVSEGSFDPENWATLTNGNDSPFAGLFNLIYGIDPDSGQTQAYMNENAFAYMAYALKMGGMFDKASSQATLDDTSMLTYSNITQPVLFANSVHDLQIVTDADARGNPLYVSVDAKLSVDNVDVSDDYYAIAFSTGGGTRYYNLYILAKHPTSYSNKAAYIKGTRVELSSGRTSTYSKYVTLTEYNDGNIRAYGCKYFDSFNFVYFPQLNTPIADLGSSGVYSKYGADLWYIINNGNISSGGIPGTGDQSGATLPDVSDWNDIPSTLQSLQNQYPDLWNNGMNWNSDDPSSNTYGDVTRYIPVAMPNFNYNNSQQPVSSTSTQTSPQLNPTTSDATLLKAITEAIQATQTQTQPNMQVPPQNPVTTGTGEPPALVPPSGSASALWSVYHPTQAQVNSFGAWLWGSPFLTNIGKLFQNPIDGVISLHKIFAMPIDSGTGNIVVGTLDSGVSSATVNQQYVTVDCGSISCMEDFGNVFDYSPFTSASIYLPFIGIVPIDVNDIMRSTIHVIYGVDVYTGACLAMIEVTRDSFTVNMYQYAGVASVEYPLSNVQNGQLVSGLLAIGAGVASMVATGGVTAPAVGAVAGGVAAGAKSNVGKSGGFSGNAGAMGIKKPYLILQRPQTKVAETFPELAGYPTNKSLVLKECSGHVVVKHVHVEGVNATQGELMEIENLLQSGVLV